MSIEPRTYYTAICDKCGVDIFEDDESTAWADAEWAKDCVEDREGDVFNETILCPDCVAIYRTRLSDDEWDAHRDRALEAHVVLLEWLRSPSFSGAEGEAPGLRPADEPV